MPFNSPSEYPDGIVYVTPGASATVKIFGTGAPATGTAANKVKVAWIMVSSTGAGQTFSFQTNPGGVVYFAVKVLANHTLVIPRGIQVDQGLQVVTGAASASNDVTVVWRKP